MSRYRNTSRKKAPTESFVQYVSRSNMHDKPATDHKKKTPKTINNTLYTITQLVTGKKNINNTGPQRDPIDICCHSSLRVFSLVNHCKPPKFGTSPDQSRAKPSGTRPRSMAAYPGVQH